MRLKTWLAAVGGVATLAGAAGVAQAQQCAGFEDVFTTETAVCPAVEWVKNRSITLGCSGTTQYCPAGNVTRAQMALFMQRLGGVLSPTVRRNAQTFGTSTLPASPTSLGTCATDLLDPAPYPRQVLANSTVNLLATGGGPVSVRTFIMASSNGGSTYTVMNPGSSQAARDTAPAEGWANASTAEWKELPANEGPWRFSISVRRDDLEESSNNGFDSLRCQLTVMVFNANPAPI